MNNFQNVLKAFDLVPVNWRISCQYPEALSWRELLIDRAHERKELFKKSRHTAHQLRSVSPHFPDFREHHILSGDIAVQDGLVQRISAPDFDVVYLFRKRRVADQRQNEIIYIFHPMRFRHADDFVLVEGSKDGRYSRFWSRFCND